MSHSHRHSYNPFALWRLRIFLRKNWALLIVFCLFLILGVGLLNKYLPLPAEYPLIGEPDLANPGELDLESPASSSGFDPANIKPTIDPAGILCPIYDWPASGVPAVSYTTRYDILNLSKMETRYLATFATGEKRFHPCYRPNFNEILIAATGVKSSFGERLLLKLDSFANGALFPKMKSCIFRFDATTGAYLGQVEVSQLISWAVGVSPDGRRLLAYKRPGSSLPASDQFVVVDLATGQSEDFPPEEVWDFLKLGDAPAPETSFRLQLGGWFDAGSMRYAGRLSANDKYELYEGNQKLKTFPLEVTFCMLLNADYLLFCIEDTIRIVRIDELLEESFEFVIDKEDK